MFDIHFFKSRGKGLSYKNLLMFDSLLYWQKPQTIYLDVTNHCNLKCKMCPHSMKDIQFEKGHMEWEFFKKVISQIDNTKSLSLFASGEPLIAKNWDRILEYCLEEKKFSDCIGFSTNGLFLNEQRARRIIGKNVAISVSIDGGTKSTYESIRKGGSFEVLLKNLRFFRDCKRKYNTDKPFLSFTFVAWKDNIMELPLVIKLASEFDSKQVTLIHRIFYKKEDFDKYSLCNYRETFDTCLEKSLELAEKLGIKLIHTGTFSRNIAPTEGLKEIYFKERANGALCCRIVDEHVTIGFKGLIRACCFIDKLFMGNLNFDSLGGIWNGPNYRNLRLKLYKGDYPDGCKNCSFVQILGKEKIACLCPLNTETFISASPKIKQSYDIITVNEEFINAMKGYKKGFIKIDHLIKKLLLLWEKDDNFFEIANNLAVLYALKGDVSNAKKWIIIAKKIIAGDPIIEKNCAYLIQ